MKHKTFGLKSIRVHCNIARDLLLGSSQQNEHATEILMRKEIGLKDDEIILTYVSFVPELEKNIITGHDALAYYNENKHKLK